MLKIFVIFFLSFEVCIMFKPSLIQAQVDYTTGLLWTSRSKEDGASNWGFVSFFGNPEVYVPIVATNGSAPQHYDWSNVYIDDTMIFTSIAADYRTHYSYFCLSNIPTIAEAMAIYFNQSSITGFENAVVSSNVKGLALDWVSKNLYWADADPLSQKIGMLSLINKNFYRPVITSGLTSLGDIEVDPNEGYLFWCDDKYIWRSNLNGDSKTNLVPFYLNKPVSLSIDYQQQRVYFYDSGIQKYGHIGYNGNSLYIHGSTTPIISAVTFFRGYLFMASKTDNKIVVMNVSTSSVVTSLNISNFFGGYNDIMTFAPEAQPVGSSPCSNFNGGCDHFCLTQKGNSKVCQCAVGYYLQNDAVTCGLTPPPTTLSPSTVLTTPKTTFNPGTEVQPENKASPLLEFQFFHFLFYWNSLLWVINRYSLF